MCPRAKNGTTLTQRENEILKLISEGLKNDQICKILWIQMSTLKSHIGNLYKKLNVQKREDAASLYKNKLTE